VSCWICWRQAFGISWCR